MMKWTWTNRENMKSESLNWKLSQLLSMGEEIKQGEIHWKMDGKKKPTKFNEMKKKEEENVVPLKGA